MRPQKSELDQVDLLVEMVRHAVESRDAATEAIDERDAALDRLRKEVGGGDRLDAIRRGYERIGWLVTFRD